MPDNTPDDLRRRLEAAGNSPDALRARLAAGTPFGAVPSNAQTGPFGGSQNPRAFQQAVELADPALSGLTFGFGDELTAAVTGPTLGGTFNERLQTIRDRSQRIESEQPGAATAAKLAGGVATGIAAGPAAVNALVAQGVPRLGALGLTGATAGAVAGAGEGEGLEGRARGAVVGGTIGAGMGIVLPLAAEGAARALAPLMNRMRGPQRQALERIRTALERDSITPQQAVRRLRELGVNATLADAGGENVRGVARAVQSVPGRGRDLATDVLEARQSGQTARLVESVNDNLRSREGFRQTLDDNIAARRTDAQALYQDAYRTDVAVTRELRTILQRPSVRQAYERAKIIAGNEGVTLPALGTFLSSAGRTIPTRTLDFMKRGLDDVIERNRNPLTGAIEGDVARGVATARGDLLETIDSLNPAYAHARAVYAGQSASIDALRQGRLFGSSLSSRAKESLDPDQILANLRDMTEGERSFFRQGLAQGLIDVIEATPDAADAVKRLIGTEARRGRLRAAFPDAESFTRFMSDLSRESRFFKTGTEVLGNSVTARLLADQGDLLGNEALAGLVQGRTAEATTNALARLIARARAPSPQVADELARFLFSQRGGGEVPLNALLSPRPPPIPPALQRAGAAGLVTAAGQAGAATGNR